MRLLFVVIFKCRGLFKKWFLVYPTILCMKVQGADVDYSSVLYKIKYSWPNKISIGKKVKIEHATYFKYDGIYSKGKAIIIGDDTFIGAACEFNIKEKIIVGKNCLIGSGSKFIDHDHGIEKGILMKHQLCPTKGITLGNDIWIGSNVVILKGVTIGDGAVVAAGAIVNKDIGAYEIWGGVPAKKIKDR
jgi:acetyltransferase-like isoleucine patch superfamily enzyme